MSSALRPRSPAASMQFSTHREKPKTRITSANSNSLNVSLNGLVAGARRDRPVELGTDWVRFALIMLNPERLAPPSLEAVPSYSPAPEREARGPSPLRETIHHSAKAADCA